MRVESPLTPGHSLGLVGMWEREGVGRVGMEYYFTGEQRLEANPYRIARSRIRSSVCWPSASSAGSGCSSTPRT